MPGPEYHICSYATLMDRQSEDIRKALERLQRTMEQAVDQIRTLHRDRKVLLERINELEEERRAMGASLNERADEALQVREQVAELEELLHRSGQEQETLRLQVLAMQTALNERDGMIAEQEDALVQSTRKIGELEERLARSRQQIEDLESGQSQSREQQERLVAAGEELEAERRRAEERSREWEGRIAEAESDRDAMRKSAEALLRERDQARATVESMLVRVRQLEAVDGEQLALLRDKVDGLTQDLEEALEMAAGNEAEVSVLREQIADLEAEIERGATHGGFSVEDQEELVHQMESALLLIDKHLSE